MYYDKNKSHRSFVGGDWYEIGKLQYQFLVGQGVEPHHKFLDLACGSLRLGQFLIPYLNKGHYHGLDAERDLIDNGCKEELLFDLLIKKEPKFIVNRDFNFNSFDYVDYGIAQSLFTHLNKYDFVDCLKKLKNKVKNKFFITFHIAESVQIDDSKSAPKKNFYYTQEQVESFCKEAGWKTHYIGDWQHPKNQKMMEIF